MCAQRKREERAERKGTIKIELGFGDLFKGLGSFVDLVERIAEEGGEVRRVGEIKGKTGAVKGVYGFSVKTAVGGAPIVETFGNIRETEAGPVVAEVREPLVDLFDEDDHILVVAELPGVAENEIKIEAKDDILTLAAESKDRKYSKEILLPAPVEPSMQKSYQNGVLQVRFKKAGPSSKAGTSSKAGPSSKKK